MINTTVAAFVTCIVIKVDMFESVIVDERHFSTKEEAKVFTESLADDLIAVIASV